MRSLNNALTLDPEEESTQVGMLALQSWYSGADGPGGHWMHAQFSKFDAGIVAGRAQGQVEASSADSRTAQPTSTEAII